ncbi:glycoside hydrolase domain-containing protein [Porticoccus sp. GXU_MW_L64]
MKTLIPTLCLSLCCTAFAVDDGHYNMPDSNNEQVTYDPRADSIMNRLATEEDRARFVRDNPSASGYYLFGEDRSNSIRFRHALPAHWLQSQAHQNRFRGTAQPGEYYVFQLGVFAAEDDLAFSGFQASDSLAKLGKVELLSDNKIDPIRVKKGTLKPLWFGIEIDQKAEGIYQGGIRLSFNGKPSSTAQVGIKVAGEVLDDFGDKDSWRLSRLRWLNSTIADNDDVLVAPFTAIQQQGKTLGILGRDLQLNDNGLPAQIVSRFNASNTRIIDKGTDVLTEPFAFVVETAAGAVQWTSTNFRFTRAQKGAVAWQSVNTSKDFELRVSGTLEMDGFVQYRCTLTSKTAVEVKDIRLETHYSKQATSYFMGLNHAGGLRPHTINWQWDSQFHQDGYWIGAVNAGLKLKFKGANFQTPPINAYYHFRPLSLPRSWSNEGKGGIRLTENDDRSVAVRTYSGTRNMPAGTELAFDFDMHITPFKPLDTDGQWKYRYFHPHQGVNDADLADMSRIKAKGANVVEIHHNKDQNPTINYPYFDQSFPVLKSAVEDGHNNGLMVNIYYTTREITNNLPELFAFKSLDGEIISGGPGKDAKPVTNPKGPHPWLIEHLRDDFIPAWREVLKGRYNGLLDLAVLTNPDSTRMTNFYLEGLDYTIKGAGIDGLYIDGTALDREGFQRARRILDRNNPNAQISMHSWSNFNELGGMASSAYVYMQNFPYYNRLWFGEHFAHRYRKMSKDEWLVEVSGIPFGLMSEMMYKGMPHRGMVFGMTGRLGWKGQPQSMWKLWDHFGMSGSTMISHWDPATPVSTGVADIPVTVYQKNDKALLALASWSDKTEQVTLKIDWQALGIKPEQATLYAPEISGVQQARQFAVDETITVEPGKGWVFSLEASDSK